MRAAQHAPESNRCTLCRCAARGCALQPRRPRSALQLLPWRACGRLPGAARRGGRAAARAGERVMRRATRRASWQRSPLPRRCGSRTAGRPCCSNAGGARTQLRTPRAVVGQTQQLRRCSLCPPHAAAAQRTSSPLRPPLSCCVPHRVRSCGQLKPGAARAWPLGCLVDNRACARDGVGCGGAGGSRAGASRRPQPADERGQDSVRGARALTLRVSGVALCTLPWPASFVSAASGCARGSCLRRAVATRRARDAS